jgi:hypothetical protein
MECKVNACLERNGRARHRVARHLRIMHFSARHIRVTHLRAVHDIVRNVRCILRLKKKKHFIKMHVRVIAYIGT